MSPARALLACLLLCQLLAYGGHQGLTKIFYTLPDAGQPPLLLSLADTSKLDLRSPDELLYTNDSEQHNDTQTFVIIEAKEPLAEPTPNEPVYQASAESKPDTTTQAPLEDQAEPTEPVPTKPETPQEDIPSFSEWSQKQLAEAEKQDTVLNHSSQPSHGNANANNKSTKLRSKNYASPACGAKVLTVNPEAGSPSSILSPNRDEYMLNSCNNRIWFIVELCEAVQAQRIEIANFELFSSTPKDLTVYFSDRFPTREWASVGQFTAKDLRDVQSFDLYPHLFGKYIKVELLSHHGSEHYCPISLFKVYGTSEFEVLEKESSQHISSIDDDDDELDVPDIPTAEAEASKNLFGSARDAVMSIMKKAAQVLVKSEVPRNVSSAHNDTTSSKERRCCSPSHIIVCDNCSQTMYNEVYELISCNTDSLTDVLRQVFVRDTIKCTGICLPFGLDFKSSKSLSYGLDRVAYLNSLLSQQYMAALCNLLAIDEKKVVLNTSFENEVNVTVDIAIDNVSDVNSGVVGGDNVNLASANNDFNPEIKPDELNEEETQATWDKTNDSIAVSELDIRNEIGAEDITTEEFVVEDDKEQKDVEANKTELNTDGVPVETKNDQNGVKNEAKPPSKIENNDKILKESPGNNGDDLNEQILIESDSFLSDFDQLTAEPTQATQNPNLQAQIIQKESVFLRLSNRVKTLERNMSLSGQYLEELSRRYKKQVEEMQKSFEKTVLQMTEERRKSNEREQKYLEQMTNLQDQLFQMASAMKILMEERESILGNVTFFKFLMYQIIIICIVYVYYTVKIRSQPPPVLQVSRKTKAKRRDKLRRKSVEGVSGHATPSIKKRRPSEEALQIARESEESDWQVKRRKRKTSVIHRANSGFRHGSIGELRETPIPLDEEEFIAPVTEPAQLTPPVEKKPNGSIFSSLKTKAKTRRLSSPAFLRTLSRQSCRSAPSPTLREVNGKENVGTSESPTSSLWSQSTEIAEKPKKKSFKSIFKKVF